MDHSQLSDFEINKLVAKATGTQVEETYQFINGGEDIADHMSGIVLMRKITSNRKHWKLYDPCNNPADAWPIIFSNRMFVDPIGVSDWSITSDCDRYREISKNPLRAAMCVFLMLKETPDA